jgi:hypothetical protein
VGRRALVATLGSAALLGGVSAAAAHTDSTDSAARTGTYTVTLLRVTSVFGPWDETDGVLGPPRGVPLGPFKLLVHTITRAAGHDTEDAIAGPRRANVPRHIQQQEEDRFGFGVIVYRHKDCTPFDPVVFRANASLLRDHGGSKGLDLPVPLSERAAGNGVLTDDGTTTDPGTLDSTGDSADALRNIIGRALTLPGSYPLPATPLDERSVLPSPGTYTIIGRAGDNVFDLAVYVVRVGYAISDQPCHDAGIVDPPPYGPPPGPGTPSGGGDDGGAAPNAPEPLGGGAEGPGGSTAVLTLERVEIDTAPFEHAFRPYPRLLARTVVRGGPVQRAIVGLPRIDTPQVPRVKRRYSLDFERVIYQHSSCGKPPDLRFSAAGALVEHRLPTALELAAVDPGGIVTDQRVVSDAQAALVDDSALELPPAPLPKHGPAVLEPGRQYAVVGLEGGSLAFERVAYYVRYDVVPARLDCGSPGTTTGFAVAQATGYDHTTPGGQGRPSTVCSDFTTSPAQAGAAFTATITPDARSTSGTLDGSGRGRVVFGIPAPGSYTLEVSVGGTTSTATINVPAPDATHQQSKSCAAPPAPA